MNVTDGQTGANSMKNCTDKLELEFSVYNVEEIGNGIPKDETSNVSNDSFCRAGPHCEKCKDDYYLQPQKDRLGRQSCSPCNCNPEGSTSGQCSPEGQCPCRDGVTGATCAWGGGCWAYWGWTRTGAGWMAPGKDGGGREKSIGMGSFSILIPCSLSRRSSKDNLLGESYPDPIGPSGGVPGLDL